MNPEIVSYGDITALSQVMKKAKQGLPVTICGIGGSITAGYNASPLATNRWLSLIGAWLQATYNCPVTVINSGIAATASEYGRLRVQRDVIAHAPDLVFVDYAVNDSAADVPSYESLLRALRAASPQIAIVPIMFCNNALQSTEGSLTPIATHYNLPIVSYTAGVTAAINAGTITQAQISSPDGVHPSTFGHSLAAQYCEELLTYAASLVTAAPIAPLQPNAFDNTTFISGPALAGMTLAGFTYSPDPGDVPILNVAAVLSSNLWDYFETPITVGAAGAVWLQHGVSTNGTVGTFAVYVDGTLTNVTDCNKPVNPNTSQQLTQVAANIAPGVHTLKVVNWQPDPGVTPFTWVCGIGTA